jgi:hypothetical protein
VPLCPWCVRGGGVMGTLNVEGVTEQDFTAAAQLEEGGVSAVLAGNADLRSRQSLGGFLTSLHSAVERLGVGEVTVDLRQLRFMNSSCFKNFITWITTLQEMSPERQYRVCFISDPTMHWQKRSLHTLSCFGQGLITVRV